MRPARGLTTEPPQMAIPFCTRADRNVGQHGVDDLLADRLPARGSFEVCGEFLGDLKPMELVTGPAAGILEIGRPGWVLQHRAGVPVHVELASGKTTQVGRIGGID